MITKEAPGHAEWLGTWFGNPGTSRNDRQYGSGWRVSHDRGTSVEAIMAQNPQIKDAGVIRAGEVIKI